MLSHLRELEAESIHVIREVAAEFARPVLLYSIGKDSQVLLHLARKAFHPAPVPFPLLHVDTTWKFREMYAFRDRHGQWEPRQQRPELWNLYNGRIEKGESIRVFPLSNWSELDVWQYVRLEDIPVVPLYFAAERPVVERQGNLIVVDDDRFRL